MTWDPPQRAAFNTAKASGTALALTLPGPYPVGTVVTLLAGYDNAASTTNPAVTPSQPTGGGAITWTQHGSGAGQGSGITTSAGAGVWQRVWTGVVTATASGDINLTWSSAVVARAAALYDLTGQAGAPTVRSAVVFGTSTGGAPAAAGGTAAQAGDLVLGYATSEDNAVPGLDTDTTNGSWADAAGANTSGGSAVTNVAVGLQWKVATGTGVQTFNPAGSADSVAAILILVGTPPVDNRNGTFTLSGGGAAVDSGRKAVSRAAGALSGGGALAAAARKAVSRAAGALSGGGSLAAVGGPPGVDNRNGSFGLTGGGEALATGRHGRTIALGTIATGGGTPAATGRKAVQRPAGVISGGGALAVVARHGALRAAALSGGGALAAGARKAVSRAVGLSGGGTPTVSGVAEGGQPKAANGTFTLTGGGAAATAARKAGRSPALAVTGGGAQVVVVRKGGRTQLLLSSGGAPAVGARSGRLGVLAGLTGGGALVATGARQQPAGPPRGSRGVARTSGYPGPGRTRNDLPGSTLAAVGPGRTRGVQHL